MRYKLYRLRFTTGIHIGEKNLDESLSYLCADTLFSALYIEALKNSPQEAQWFITEAKEGRMLLSDAFPYINDTEYLPKPMLRPDNLSNEGDSSVKKAFKKLTYIPADLMDKYLNGDLDPVIENDRFRNLGSQSVKTSVAINGLEETLPYHVGIFRFYPGCGLYFIVGAEEEYAFLRIYDLIDSLSFTGLGGKKSSGLGKFEIDDDKDLDANLFERQGKSYMTLGVSLPRDEELDDVLEGAQYGVKKRSGFIDSDSFAAEQRKKTDLYVFTAGSCFRKRFGGDVYDVSSGGTHPVYRYAKPIFWTI